MMVLLKKIRKILIELDIDLLSGSSLILVIVGLILFKWFATNLPLLSTPMVILGAALPILSSMLAAILYFVKIRRDKDSRKQISDQ